MTTVKEVRTRFAPSPTGYLHVGSARTALYSYLYAKKHKGIFILRIEDTDLERSSQESVQAILDGMEWLGLKYDDGPYYQTHRFDRYKAVAQELIAQKKAYKCYCSKERLEKLRNQQMADKAKPRYDGLCRNIKDHPENTPHVIRFLNPDDGEVVFDDAVHGKTAFRNNELDDLIIVRTDGSPTYNFTVVVDDWEMKITHVIRGDDHLNNTPRQINILKALGAEIPIYAHIPMILGTDGKKLSKRDGTTVSVMQYREEGFLPHALLNYLVRLGWSHGDQEIFSLKEMEELFDITDVNKAAASFNTSKLIWLNQHFLKTDAPSESSHEFAWHLSKLGIDISNGPLLTDIINIQKERAKTLKEMAERSLFFFQDITAPKELQEKHITETIKPALKLLKEQLENLADFSDEPIHDILNTVAAKFELKLGDLAQPVRVILTGGTVSPPLQSTIRVLGKIAVINKLSRFI
ncbi:MAG TPA: glutamate--tRNA ligase [Gammaproteobacteria bacterium]|nr:glutamate--tRNA ligase [Gammaproteobacteria bacterium]